MSYCWDLPYGYDTSTLPEVSHEITKDKLEEGDAMLYKGGMSHQQQHQLIGYSIFSYFLSSQKIVSINLPTPCTQARTSSGKRDSLLLGLSKQTNLL